MRTLAKPSVKATFLGAAFLLSLAGSAPAAEERRATVLSIGGYAPHFSTRLLDDFEAAVRAEGSGAAVEEIETHGVSYAGAAYRFSGAPEGEPATVPALESADGFLVLDPPQPGLLDRVRERAAADHFLPAFFARRAVLGGGRILVETPRRAASQPRATMAVVYSLTVDGKPARAIFLLKVHGGLGRLASALRELSPPGGTPLVVSHGDWSLRGLIPPPRGRSLYDALERLGLKAAAVGAGELAHWNEFQAYLRERPGGIRFLSANLHSAESPVPGTAVLEAGGLRIGLIGLTRTSYARYLGRGALARVTLSDPIEAARAAVADLRGRTDLIVALSNLERPDDERLKAEVPGLDALISEGAPRGGEEEDAQGARAFELKRAPFSPCLFDAPDLEGIERLTFAVGPSDADGLRRVEVDETQRALDESLPDAEGLAGPTAEELAPSTTAAALIPGGHKVFPDGRRVGAREFWTLAATLLADRTRSEVGLMAVEDAGPPPPGDYREADVRARVGWDDALAAFELPGDALAALLREAEGQRRAEARGAPAPGLRLAAGGVGPGGTVHGTRVDRNLIYRVTGSELLLANAASYPELLQARNVELRGDLGDALLADLRRRAALGWPPRRYGELMEGLPVDETPFWTLHVRDLSARFTSTKVVRDSDAFARVPNSRISGFDQRQAGVNLEADAEYRFRGSRWTNTVETAYSETRLSPRDAPEIIDMTDNRVYALTAFTQRLSSFPWSWLGQSAGPSLGLQYDGEVKRRTPDSRRRNIYSVNPGVEIYDGTVVETLQLSGTVRRDYSVEPPESQYGARARAVWSANVPVGHGGLGKLQGEIWNAYYFRRHNDRPADLQLEGDANARLRISLWKDLDLAPFIDVYWFKLKARPVNGYSAMTGVSLSFSRLWKPQYEKF